VAEAPLTDLPTAVVIPFPSRPPRLIEFMPERREMESVYVTLCVSWQFAHLDRAGIDRAVDELVRMNRDGAIRMIRENANAIRWLYEANDFLIEVDARMQESLTRVINKLETN
jgi:hypothetical protein